MRRLFLSIVTSALLAMSFLAVGSASIAEAKADCDQTHPSADVVTSQTATQSATTSNVTYHVTLTNLGPCNIPDVTFHDITPFAGTLPNPILSTSTNPSAWNCGTAYVGTSGNWEFDCVPTSTMGVPGTVDIYFTTAAPSGDPTNVAKASVGTGTQCTSPLSNPASQTCDLYTDNNTSYGGLVSATSTSRTIHTPNPGNAQYTQVTVPSGHSLAAQIQQLAGSCPAGFHSCFGQMVSIASASTAPDAQTKTFVYPLSQVASYGNAVIKRLDPNTNTWVVPPDCKGKILPDPCLLSKDRFKEGGITYVRFVVLTAEDDFWWGDN